MIVTFFDKSKFFRKIDFYMKGKADIMMLAFSPLKMERKDGTLEGNNQHSCK